MNEVDAKYNYAMSKSYILMKHNAILTNESVSIISMAVTLLCSVLFSLAFSMWLIFFNITSNYVYLLSMYF